MNDYDKKPLSPVSAKYLEMFRKARQFSEGQPDKSRKWGPLGQGYTKNRDEELNGSEFLTQRDGGSGQHKIEITETTEDMALCRVQELEHQFNAGSTAVKKVAINDGQRIEALPGANAFLFTKGLNGCQLVLLVTQFRDGKTHAILTHYPPNSLEENARKLCHLFASNPELRDKGAKHTALIVEPGRYNKDYTLTPMIPATSDVLKREIQNLVGIETEIQSLVYPIDEFGGTTGRSFVFNLLGGKPGWYYLSDYACGTGKIG